MAADGVVVVDWGAHSLKAGFASQTRPQAELQRPRGVGALAGGADEAAQLLRDLEGRLGAKLAGRTVVVGIPVTAPRRAREDLAQAVFEQLGAEAAFVGSTAFLSALGAGLSTAVVIDIGESGACVVPVEDGLPLASCTARGTVGGAFLSNAMAEMMQEASLQLPEGVEWPTAGRLAKEHLAYVAPDFDQEMQRLGGGMLNPRSCSLPGGCAFESLRGEGFRCAELLFGTPSSPSCGNLQLTPLCKSAKPEEAIPELVMSSLRLESKINLRGTLLEGLLLAGGTSKLPGLPERLLHEVRSRSPWVAPGKKPDEVQLHAPPAREHLAWLGGASLAECDVLRQLRTTKGDFQEHGARAVHRRFM